MSWRDRAIPVSGASEKTGSWRDRAIPVQNYREKTITVQEQHPDISTKDRLIAKNFAQDEGKQMEYLKQQYPNLEFDVSSSGQIRAKSAGSNTWKVLDPDTGFFSKDILNDAGDVAYDIYSGVSEGGATALGAVLGNIPGAIAGGAASTAGNEAMRQKLGQYLGVPQEVSGEDVAISGAIGAVSPVLFGAGKAKGAVNMGLDAAGQGLKKINPLPWIGEKVSGVPREILRNYADDGTRQTVTGLEKEGVSDYSGKVFDKLKNYVEGRKDKAGQELVEAIETAGKPVNINPAKQEFSGRIDRLAENDLATNADQETVEALTGSLRKYLGRANTDELLPDDVPANVAWKVQKDLSKMAKWNQNMSHADYETKGAARDAYFRINEGLNQASDGLSSKAKDQYSAAIKEEAELLPKFTGKTRADSIQKTYNEMSRLDRQGRKILQEKLSKLSDDGALDLSDEAKVLSTYKWLGNPNIAPVSSGGTTSTSRTIPLAIAGGTLGSLAGYNTGGGYAGASVGGAGGAALGTLLGSPAAMKAYIRAGRKLSPKGKPMTPRRQGLYRGLKNALAIEGLNEPD